MFSSLLGVFALLTVVFVSVLERGPTEIRYFDWHAAIVVLGGVVGSLLLALKGETVVQMIRDWLSVISGRDPSEKEIDTTRKELELIETAWRAGRRGEVLNLAEGHRSKEVRTAASALIHHLNGARLKEKFEVLRHESSTNLLPQIEGWDLVARLGPSFGIVGTVAGMVQLFKNMASSSGGLGGAMALALLATLYGILLGTAVGGPMSTRLNRHLNERQSLIDLFEMKIAALVEEDRSKKQNTHEALS